MTALNTDRRTAVRGESTARSFPVKLAANAIIYQGGMVAVDGNGYAHAAASTAGYRVIGLAMTGADNTGGADGALSVQVRTGPAKMANDATDPVAQADIGRPCFVKDDQTVQTAAGGSTVFAGRLDQIDGDGGAWVVLEPEVGAVGGETISPVVDASTGAGVPVVHTFDLADAASGNHDTVIKEAFEVLDVTVIKNGAGAANTLQVLNTAAAVTDAIAAAVDKAVTRAGTIDRANNLIAAGGTLRLAVVRAAGSGAMKVIVSGVKR